MLIKSTYTQPEIIAPPGLLTTVSWRRVFAIMKQGNRVGA